MNKDICWVISIKAKPAWLKLSREQRHEHWGKVGQIVHEYADRVQFRYFDADAFHADHSDMIICESDTLLDYHHLWDRIKDTAVFADGYYDITDVRIAIKGVHHG